MASSESNKLLTKEQVLETRLNTRIAYKAPSGTGTRTYPIQLFCNNDKKIVNKNAIPVCLYNRVWHQITHDSSTGLPKLLQSLTSIHNFNIKGIQPTPKPKRENDDSSSNKSEEEKDLDDELAKQTGGLHIDNQIRGAEIPRELTP